MALVLGVYAYFTSSNYGLKLSQSISTGTGISPLNLNTFIMSGIFIAVTIISDPTGNCKA